MEREVDLNQITDGKRYLSNDMVKLECEDCDGCCDCCTDMGDSILLDPYDMFILTSQLGRSFESFIDQEIELGVVNHLILPHLKMIEPELKCSFLNEEGRCRIHQIRPGFCRIFPLGRIYENGSFSYFYQNTACTKGGKSKIKIKKWIGIPNLASYENYVLQWHDFLQEIQIGGKERGFEWQRESNVRMLKLFYQVPYDGKLDFYSQFAKRMSQYIQK